MNFVLRTLLCASIVISLFAMTMVAEAAIQYWDGGGGVDNSYHNPLNWYNADVMYDNMVPGAADDANVDNGGTVLINQDVTVARFITGRNSGASGHAEVTNGVVNIDTSFYLAYQQNTVSHFVLSGGTVNSVNRFLLAAEVSSVGTFHQTGGTMSVAASSNQWTRIGYLNNSYGYYDLSGGVLELGPTIIGNNGGDGVDVGVGILNQTGGALTLRTTGTLAAESSLRIGTNGGAIGVYNLTGGTCHIQTGFLAASSSGAYSPLGLINIGGTGQLTVDYQGGEVGYVRFGYVSPSTGRLSDGIVNLATGGVLRAPLMRSGDGVNPATAGNGSLNFHGGTLVTNADQTDYIRLADAYIYAEGAKIDTDGHDVTFKRGLLAPTGLGVQSIALAAGSSDYAGPPAVRLVGGSGTGAAAIAHVSNGTVTGFTVTNPGSGYQPGDVVTAELFQGGYQFFPAQAGTVTLGANTSGGLEKLGAGTLTLGGTSTYTGATSVKAGGLAITGSITSSVTVDAIAALGGTGTIHGDVDLNGTFKVAYDSDADTMDLLTITGLLDLTGATISLADVGAGSLSAGQYVFASYGSLIGNPATEVGLEAGWSIDYAHNGNSIALVVSSVSQIPGDANNSGTVDEADAKILATNWGAGGANWGMGDFNGDGVVNAIDAAILAANWSAGGTTEATAVPEPGVLAALLAALAMMTLIPRKSRRD